jgi:hypothetical protein
MGVLKWEVGRVSYSVIREENDGQEWLLSSTLVDSRWNLELVSDMMDPAHWIPQNDAEIFRG